MAPRGYIGGGVAGTREVRGVRWALTESLRCTSMVRSASNFTDLSVFLRILRTNYGQKVNNTDAKSAPEGVAVLR